LKKFISHWVDRSQYPELSANEQHFLSHILTFEQHFLSHILTFFAATAGIINDNLLLNFSPVLVQSPKVSCFYGFQITIENAHTYIYSLLIMVLILSVSEHTHLFQAINILHHCAPHKANWALCWAV
jgi:ribonucleotide reductase beta subunit family protein with ferritin-like domain